MTFTLPHWVLTFSWWMQAFLFGCFVCQAIYRVAGGSWTIAAPKGPGERAWFVVYYLICGGATAAILMLARRAL